VADALDPLLITDQVLVEDIGLTEKQVQMFRASLEASKQ